MSKKSNSTSKAYGDLRSQRRKRYWFGRFSFIGKILLLILLYLFLFTPHLKFVKKYLSEVFYETAGEFGFILENVAIKGNKYISVEEVVSDLNADVGTPIFAIPLEDSYHNIRKNNWVKDVSVSRVLPSTIMVSVVEKEPIAIWQNQKKLYVIDADGNIITDKIDNFSDLLHVVGIEANIHAHTLISDLNSDPTLASSVLAAVRYGERRWNLILKQNITVKMPEAGFGRAYDYLVKLNQQEKLFDNGYKTIDLRDSSKYYTEKNSQ